MLSIKILIRARPPSFRAPARQTPRTGIMPLNHNAKPIMMFACYPDPPPWARYFVTRDLTPDDAFQSSATFSRITSTCYALTPLFDNQINRDETVWSSTNFNCSAELDWRFGNIRRRVFLPVLIARAPPSTFQVYLVWESHNARMCSD